MISVLLDTSNTNLAVGIAKDHVLIGGTQYAAWQRQSEYLVPEIDNLLKKLSLTKDDIDEILKTINSMIKEFIYSL